jgi:hypothetical protein
MRSARARLSCGSRVVGMGVSKSIADFRLMISN